MVPTRKTACASLWCTSRGPVLEHETARSRPSVETPATRQERRESTKVSDSWLTLLTTGAIEWGVNRRLIDGPPAISPRWRGGWGAYEEKDYFNDGTYNPSDIADAYRTFLVLAAPE